LTFRSQKQGIRRVLYQDASLLLSDGDVASGPSRAALYVLVCELIETKNRRVVLSISSSVPEPSREEGALD
jgi:hypothetical protein